MDPAPPRRTVVVVHEGSGTAADDLRRVLDPLVYDVRDADATTEADAAAARLSAAEADLRERTAELTAWAERAGHDLMTPLAVISGMAETLDLAWDRLSPADRSQLLTSIRNQAGRATTLLESALARRAPP